MMPPSLASVKDLVDKLFDSVEMKMMEIKTSARKPPAVTYASFKTDHDCAPLRRYNGITLQYTCFAYGEERQRKLRTFWKRHISPSQFSWFCALCQEATDLWRLAVAPIL
ncbi:hypothetical protein L596_017669 [Steinernema carpocapsae]|uniref:Uncharacterized protein n=1 Tax=Steinernema carpocapsae TaxID=34508 RepID=A0A4U5N2P4_STECR|nr:hypothetical protein L596_017669 [Steinernema carpocapsae]